ncbi:GLPGLI family protein [Zunongwangia endophytica]|uniref:GLPGLI family protein n=1 Tax=Zunongwangia endophytica TaxID=1808945 RepID=A0ABV8HCY8_9FLAO|nr:GLPGLI family protein [Zunongwangia endophytica]MDN3593632.1 GLPGLI family protein [Zunongwangia endophytica]
MKKVITLSIILFLFSLNFLQAQQTTGIVLYKGIINEEFRKKFLDEIKKKDVAPEIRKGVIDMYMNADEDKYELHFRDQESYYHYIEPLDNDADNSLKMGSRAGSDDYYVNLSKDQIIQKTSSLGLVAYPKIEWEIQNEKQEIGDYKCFKAIGTEKHYGRDGEITDEEVIAWFTAEVPLQFGPKNYNGLQGLILRIDKEKFSIVATEIMLNPDEKIKIDTVKKNAKIRSQKEAYEALQLGEQYYKDKYGNK